MRLKSWIFVSCIVLGLRQPASAALPPEPSPAQPFPQIVSDAFTSEFVAPGITYGEYALFTKDGPVDIHVVAVNLQEPTVRIDTVLANDALVSAGETPSSMAVRTGAVAGINADYFDIGNTNQPLGVVVRGGQLLRTPNTHSAFAITHDRHVLMLPLTFTGSAVVGTIPIALAGVNEWPPREGVSLMTPAFGALPPIEGVTVAELTPLDPAGATVGRYRIESVRPAAGTLPRGYALAISANAYQTLGEPQIGDVVTLSQTSAPPLETFAAAVGGGPLLVHNSARFAEADAPAANEGRTRIPLSGAALRADGTLLLIEVDGREPLHSIGLTRDEFASFLLALGAIEAVSFDGGGSSALVARRLGDRTASVRNIPSDGSERPVADGLFIYSDAEFGPPARLVVHPSVVRAFPGASVTLATAVTDASGHWVATPAQPLTSAVTPAAVGILEDSQRFVARTNGSGVLRLTRGPLVAEVPVHVVDAAARVLLTPRRANLRAGESMRFSIEAFDRAGFPIALPEHLAWSASRGHVTDSGEYTAENDNGVVQVKVGETIVREQVTVGEHDMELQMGTAWRFTSTPSNNPGSVSFGVPCPVCIQLDYDFSGSEHGATMAGSRPLPEEAIGLRFDVNGDGNGEILRISLINAINERVYLSVGRVNWHGWQTKEVRFPASLAVPAELHTIYVLNSLNSPPIHAAGSIAIRNVRAIIAGK